jgi:hypothetical protein
VLALKDVDANARRGEEATQKDSQIRSSTIESAGGRRPRCPRKGRHQRKERIQLKAGGDPLTNHPLWVKLNFRLGEVPSLVDTRAQFSCIRRDVMHTLTDLPVKVNKPHVGCRVTWLTGCVAIVQSHFCWDIFGEFSV